ncbi:MAG: alginate export family protein [Armatimonadetes bacterium]|nr:alginate export family protein [Armatimonadota bacterium]
MARNRAVTLWLATLLAFLSVSAYGDDQPSYAASGEIRVRAESRNNADFADVWDDQVVFSGERIRLGVSASFPEKARGFLQLQYTAQGDGRILPSNGYLGLHQGWLEAGKNPVIRVGRQELNYGDQRIVGSFGWSNIARSYDGVKITWKQGKFSGDLFGVRPLNNNLPLRGVLLYGAYGQWSPDGLRKVDLYLLDKSDRSGAGGVGDINVVALGVRAAGPIGRNGDYSGELVLETGKVGPRDLRASAYDAALGHTWRSAPWSPRLGIEYAYATGDSDPTDAAVETFDQLFPTNHDKYGYADYQGWRNMQDFRISLSVKPSSKLTLSLDHHWFSLAQPRDGWYGAGGGINTSGATVLRSLAGIAGTNVGTEWDLAVTFVPGKNYRLSAGYSRFTPGPFVRTVLGGTANSSDWSFLMGQHNF